MSEIIEQPRAVGRPCLVCSHSQRQGIEMRLLEGESISGLAASLGIARSSIRRHLVNHMELDEESTTAMGLDAASIALRVHRVAERAREAADVAEDAGHSAAVLRAGDAELRALGVLSAMGIKHEQPLAQYAAYRAVTRAALIAARTHPEVGEAIAAVLDQTDHKSHAREVRAQFLETKEVQA